MNYLNSTKEERQELLKGSYEERLEASKECIRQVLAVAKSPVIQFSGGADSCVMADIIHNINPDIPCLFNDWGLFLPEQEAFCRKFFQKYEYKFTVMNSGVTWQDFITKKGFPIFKGLKYVDKADYNELKITKSCRSLRKKCWSKFMKENPTTDYFFVGMLADESPQRKSLFIQYGFVSKKEKGTLVKPIILLTKQEVFDYLKKNKIMYPKDYYKDEYKGETFEYNHCDLGCFLCGTRFKEYGFGRLGRLARERPDIFHKTMDMGLRDTFQKIREKYPQSEQVKLFLEEYDKEVETGFDLDGVLTVMPKRPKPFFQQTGAERKVFTEKKLQWFLDAPCLWNPQRPGHLITGRRENRRGLTEQWLSLNSVRYKALHMMDTKKSLTFDNIIEHKINKIKELGIKRYFEDDEKLVKGIRKACADVEVIHVPRDTNSVKIIE